jgi:hypothetical protein
VKKIAVGESHSYLLKILREVCEPRCSLQTKIWNTALGAALGEATSSKHHHLSSCMAGNMPIFGIWSKSSNTTVSTPYCRNINDLPATSVLMQWAEGGRQVPSHTHPRIYQQAAHFFSLDDFIDIRQGRASNKYHVDHLAESNPFDTPSLDSTKHFPGPSTSPPPTDTRSARIRAFRMLHRAAPEDRERLRRAMNADPDIHTGDSGGKSWTAVHLLSAEEVRSLFSDVVGGLAFLVRSLSWPHKKMPGNLNTCCDSTTRRYCT